MMRGPWKQSFAYIGYLLNIQNIGKGEGCISQPAMNHKQTVPAKSATINRFCAMYASFKWSPLGFMKGKACEIIGRAQMTH